MKKIPSNPPVQTTGFYEAHSYEPNESIGYLMRRILSGMKQEVEHELESSGLTDAQWLPLFKLALGKVDTGAGLAHACELDAGATTRLLDRLESKGLCERIRSEQDRRVIHLRLTPTGEQAAARIPEALSQVHNHALTGFSKEELDSFKQMLRRILTNIEAVQTHRQNHES